MDRLQTARLTDGHDVVVRPSGADDADAIQAFVRRLSPESRRRRFFAAVSELAPAQLRRLTAPDGADALSVVALSEDGSVVGTAQCALDDAGAAEFAVADDWRRSGLGARLIDTIAAHARARGASRLCAQVMWDNDAMLGLAARLGFSLRNDADPTLVRIERALAPRPRHGRTSAGTAPVFTQDRIARTVAGSTPTNPWALNG